MSKQFITITGIAVVFSALSARGTVIQAAETRPHVVVFLSDDHTWQDCSVYGSTENETPNMLRLADAGMAFNSAFVASPSCAPSRAALLTGLMPARNGAERNHARPRADIKKLPAYFQELGYEVVSFGKVGHYRQTTEYGFDLARHFNYHEDVAVGEAVKWLRARSSDKPLCLFVGTNWPHVPWPQVPDDRHPRVTVPETHVDTPQTRVMRARYYEAIRTMDQELGEVYDTAREVLGDDILFVHTSDHGAQWPFGKWTLYDEGIRTPLIVSWPGHVAAGVRTDAMVSWVDLLPTLLEAAGGDVPDGLDGRSFLPVLRGQATSHRDQIFTVHSGDGNFNVFPMRSVRDRQFKYIRNLHPEFELHSHVTKVREKDAYWPTWEEAAQHDENAAQIVRRYQVHPAEEFYDLTRDPQELHNLAEEPEYREQLTQMRTRLEDWMQQQGDQQKVYGLPKLLPRPGPRPNVITVFIDDMGWADLSCFGGKDVQTTQIDRLATEGLRFTNFYVNSPICSPSRTALTTGNYPARHRITSYLAHRALNNERQIAHWLEPDVPTLPRMMHEAGYATGHFGKWHMGGQRDVGEAPLISAYGFDRSLTNFEGLGPRVLPLCDNFDGQPPRRHDLGSAQLGQGPIRWLDRSLITAEFVTHAVEFIDEAVAREQPFFVNIWPDDVHSPFFPPETRRGDGSKRQRYLGVLKTMDEQLGVLFDRIRRDDRLRKNTIIILASDNGHEIGAGRPGPLRGSKGNLYEGGIRSPLIVWAPGMMQEHAVGSSNDRTIVSSIDLVASLMNLGDVSQPEGYQGDGEDLLAVLLGVSDEQREGPLFWRRPPDHPGPDEMPHPDLAVRDGPWKLVCQLDGDGVELYNLPRDIGESRNVADRHPQIVQRLRQAVLDWNATLPVDGVR
ncbi:MAG: sulfatase-like hydrolase/transferase [Planctomycetales bacterium]|nr:sulfatase-like hydrolase/transferase [Planctomycetales bacterium]